MIELLDVILGDEEKRGRWQFCSLVGGVLVEPIDPIRWTTCETNLTVCRHIGTVLVCLNPQCLMPELDNDGINYIKASLVATLAFIKIVTQIIPWAV